MTALQITGLTVAYGATVALEDVSLRVGAGEIVALVGTSGSGKSTLAAAAMRLLPPHAAIAGIVRIDGTDTTGLDEVALQAVRGGRVGIVFQEPATALNPALTIGRQIGEVLAAHTPRSRTEIAAAVAGLLAAVGLDLSPARYPHSLSGGQRQRVAIAIAIAANPALLIADEPTASLDPSAQQGITELLVSLARERRTGLLLVTHDLSLARRVADRIVTLAQGRIVANAPDRATVTPARPTPAAAAPLLTMTDVTRTYAGREGRIAALSDVSLTLAPGETLAVIGDSGSGKSTLARLALGLDEPDEGHVAFDGRTWRAARGRELRAMRRRVQAVFQDPAASFDARQTVGQIVAEPLYLLGRLSKGEREGRVAAALGDVGLPADAALRLPQAFSGGQRQRIAIARALISQPALIVFDEALSALDDAVADEIVGLLTRLQATQALAYLFIAHDMALVRRMADRVLILEQGRVAAYGSVGAVMDRLPQPA